MGGKREAGVGLLISETWKASLIEYVPVNVARFAVRPWSICLVVVYAPTAAKGDKEKVRERIRSDTFYENLFKVLDNNAPRSDAVIILGGFNVQLGPLVDIASYALGRLTPNSQRLRALCEKLDLVVANGLKKLHPRKLWTWRRADDGLVSNQIDFLLVPRAFRSGIGRCQSYNTSWSTDHRLVKGRFRMRLTKSVPGTLTKRPRWNFSELIPEFELMLEAKIQQSAANPKGARKEEMWVKLKIAIIETAAETVPTLKSRSDPWVSEETVKLLKQRTKAKGAGNRRARRIIERKLRRRIHKDRRQYTVRVFRECNIAFKCDFSALKGLREKLRSSRIRLPHPFIVSQKGAGSGAGSVSLTECASCCAKLYEAVIRPMDDCPNISEIPAEQLEPSPLLSEVENALRECQGCKTMGPDGVCIELLKLGGDTRA